METEFRCGSSGHYFRKLAAQEATCVVQYFFGNFCADPDGVLAAARGEGPGQSKAMDLNNNQIGIDLATDPETSSLGVTQGLDLLQQMALNGELHQIK